MKISSTSPRALSTFVLVAFSAATLLAAADPFVGTWKLNLAKSKFAGQQLKIDDLGQNRYRFTGGSDSDTITADGTDQPVRYGRTEAITKQGPNVWNVVMKKDGKVIHTAVWTLSGDGKTLAMKGSNVKPDGMKDDYAVAWKRNGGGSGWGGTWESAELQISSPDEYVISSYQGDGLAFDSPGYKEGIKMKFDGKDYPAYGPNMPSGSVSSGKRVNANTLEITDKIKDKVVDTANYAVSGDGRTLTITIRQTGQPKPLTLVYEKK